MPSNTVLRTLTTPPVRGADGSLDTRPAYRDGTRGGTPAPAGRLFSENFDEQPEWDGSQDLATSGVTGWFKSRNGEKNFAKEGIYITGSVPGASIGGSGKSLVCWRESYEYPDPEGTGSSGPANNWYKDGQLDWYAGPGNGKTKLFVRFKMLFDPNWTPAGQTKMFRLQSWDENDPSGFYSFFRGGNSGPIMLWAYNHNAYGLRNFFGFRTDPQEGEYFLQDGEVDGLPRSMNSGDVDCNFDGNIRYLNGPSGPSNPVTMIDKTTGQVLQPGTITHDQVYGDTENTVEFYVKMNSAPGVKDGVLKQWVNGQLCFSNESIAWMAEGSPGGRKWNVAGWGGNAHFMEYPNEDGVEEWVSFDDIEIYDELPEDML